MTQPIPYSIMTDFSDDEAAAMAGRSTVRTAQLDAELAAIELTVGQILENLGILQRDDTNLRDGTVKVFTLASDVLSIFATAGSAIRGAWVTATAYAVKDVVTQGGGTYICATAHTSGTFATDLAAVKWVTLYSAAGTPAASAVTFTPAGGIAATDVQAAIAEVDSEKMRKDANLSDLGSAATARTNLSALNKAGDTMTGALTLSGAPTVDLHAATKAYVDDIINGLNKGQCRLTFVNATAVRLDPWNGNKLFINGEWLTVPAAGTTLSNAALSASTLYYVYAYSSGGTLTLEASVTAPAVDATYGHKIKTADGSRTLVGLVRMNGSSQFQDNETGYIGVLSWFNQRKRISVTGLAAADTRSSASYGEVNSSIRNNFACWAEDRPTVSLTTQVDCSAFPEIINTGIGINSTSSDSIEARIQTGAVNEEVSYAMTLAINPGIGFHYAAMLGKTTGGTATWRAGNLSKLVVEVMG